MSYSSNPLLPKARAQAVRLVVEDKLSLSVAARKSGIHRTTLWRWYKRWQALGYGGYISNIPTRSSRPLTFGRAVPEAVVDRIRHYRIKYNRCAVVTHAYCVREGTIVSLSTVRRVLYRHSLVVRKKWQRKWYPPVPRPIAAKPGDLVQIDTVHLWHGHSKPKTYLYTLVDVYSRWAYTEHHTYISQELAARVIQRGEAYAGFKFQTVQADNGPEFGRDFGVRLKAQGTALRHSRVRKPNDNAHIERFNRTIQEECITRYDPGHNTVDGKILTYLAHYNDVRLHLGIQCRTPQEMLQR